MSAAFVDVEARLEAALQLENGNRPASLDEKRAIALRWLGGRYLLAEPVNRPRRLRKRELTETNS
jgi:hypothetical protein